jgi:hypothetical protein
LEPAAIRGTMPGLDSINYADITSKGFPDGIRAFFKYVKESGNRNCEEITKTIACAVGAGSFGVVVETSPTDESVYKISGIKDVKEIDEIQQPRAYANKFSEFFAGGEINILLDINPPVFDTLVGSKFMYLCEQHTSVDIASCDTGGKSAQRAGRWFILQQNRASGNVIRDITIPSEERVGMVVQLLYTVYILQTTRLMVHGDLHNENIVVETLETPQVVELQISGEPEIKIKTRRQPRIIDFGKASFYSPSLKTVFNSRRFLKKGGNSFLIDIKELLNYLSADIKRAVNDEVDLKDKEFQRVNGYPKEFPKEVLMESAGKKVLEVIHTLRKYLPDIRESGDKIFSAPLGLDEINVEEQFP